jgi:hypothetical protein
MEMFPFLLLHVRRKISVCTTTLGPCYTEVGQLMAERVAS